MRVFPRNTTDAEKRQQEEVFEQLAARIQVVHDAERERWNKPVNFSTHKPAVRKSTPLWRKLLKLCIPNLI